MAPRYGSEVAEMQGDESVLDIMGSARSMRWFREDPVDAELLDRLVWAGTRASSPGNSQGWDFIVVTAPEVKQNLQRAMAAAYPFTNDAGQAQGAPPLPDNPTDRRTVLGAHNVITTLHRVPAIIFVCGADIYPAAAPKIEWAYSAVFAAAQNMIVAARAMGLGAAFTTFHVLAEAEVREILGIPDDRFIGVTMPVGWPARPFGPVTRRPTAEVTHRDHW